MQNIIASAIALIAVSVAWTVLPPPAYFALLAALGFWVWGQNKGDDSTDV